MNGDDERAQNAIPANNISAPYVTPRPIGRIRSWFRRPDERMARERNLRLEERRKERAHTMGKMHTDSLDRASLNPVLLLMHRVIAKGHVALYRSSELAPASLEQALSYLLGEFKPSTVKSRICVIGQRRALKPAIQEQVLLIGREALVNAIRHSEATRIEAEVEYSSSQLRIILRDNGRGIDPQVVQSGRNSPWGLLRMRERAEAIGAQIRIWSGRGAGTEVEISVPGNIAAKTCA